MKKTTQNNATGKIISYNGNYGFISYSDENIYFQKKSLTNDNDFPCKNDMVSFKTRISRTHKDKKEAFDIRIVEYGNFRERLNSYIRLGSDNVKYGLVKWFDKNKGFGVVIDSTNTEYFWRDSSYMSSEVNTGDPIIFTTEYNNGKYRIKKCRFPQLLEDWNFFKDLSDSEVQFIIKTYCKVDPYSTGSRSMGNRDIKYNLKTNACDKILRKQNAHLFKDVTLLSDLILYAASHHSWLHITINSFKHLYTEDGFKDLSHSLFDIIKNYKELWGVRYLIDFIFEYKNIIFNDLSEEERKNIVDTYIKHTLITLDRHFTPQPKILVDKYLNIKQFFEYIKDDIEISSYFYDKLIPLLSVEVIVLLFFDFDFPHQIDRSILGENLTTRFLGHFGITMSSRPWISKWETNVPFYGIDLKRRFFSNQFIPQETFTGIIKYCSTCFDILKLLIIDENINKEVRQELLLIIFENLYTSSINLILDDEVLSDFILEIMGKNETLLNQIKRTNNEKFITKINENVENFDNEQKLTLMELGLVSIGDYNCVFELTRGLPVSIIIDTFAFLKRNNEVLYWSFFNKIYPFLTIEERVNLWLSNLNNHYDYAELLQGAHKLSVNQRKLLNKKIKEHAKEERFVTFLTQIPDAEITEKNDKEIVYKCKWRNLYYKNGEVIVFINKTDALETYIWSPAREEWNWLTNEYFNRKRIGDIYVYTRNRMIMNIIGLEEIEERIIIADIQKKGTLNNKRIIANDQIVRIIHNVAARNKCIDFLSRQDSHFDAVDIQELVSTQYGEIKRDISFMFIIPNNSFAYIIWESVEFEKSKATYIFRCNVDSALLHANNVKDYIENNIYIRSKLSYESDNSDLRKEMKFFAKVNHDSQNYEIWESRMKEILPFMK